VSQLPWKISRVFLACALICFTHEAFGSSWFTLCGLVGKAVDLPDPLPLTPREKEYSNALEHGGIVLSGKQPLPSQLLEDGRYVYLVATYKGKEFVAWGLSAQGEITPEKNLLTHTSLFNQLTRELGAEPEIVAAGQALILNGKVGILDNKSGTRRGGPEHLAYAAKKLAQHGLAVTPATQKKDYSKSGVAGAHAKAAQLARMRVQVDKDPALKNLREAMNAMHTSLFRQAPALESPERPGHLNLDKVFDAERVEGTLGRKLTPSEKEEMDFAAAFFDIFEKEGADFMVIRLQERGLLAKDFAPAFDLARGREPAKIPSDRADREREAHTVEKVKEVTQLLAKAERIMPERLFDLGRIAAAHGKPLTPLDLSRIEYARRLVLGYRQLGEDGLRLLVNRSDYSGSNFFNGLSLAAGETLYSEGE